MTPHLEEFRGPDKGWLEIQGTRHSTGDRRSIAALRAHRLAKAFPVNKQEVADDLGPVCPGYEQATLIAEQKKREA